MASATERALLGVPLKVAVVEAEQEGLDSTIFGLARHDASRVDAHSLRTMLVADHLGVKRIWLVSLLVGRGPWRGDLAFAIGGIASKTVVSLE